MRNRKRQIPTSVTVMILLLSFSFLSGCMYGDRVKQAGAPASGEYIALVQNAMEMYRNKTGVLPIKNKDADTPELERYLIDFKKLKDAHILTTVPTNAFENGGTALYVVARTETEPQVKLLDLISYQQAVDLQQAVDQYTKEHAGELPKGESVTAGYWLLDYKKLNRKAVQIRSPYSPQMLYPVLDESGTVGIDYTPEIQRTIQKKAIVPDKSEDLRNILLDESYFVPAKSFPYYWSGEAPVLSAS
jgi:hypothetical protein